MDWQIQVSRKIAELRKAGDQIGAACLALRYRATCPACRLPNARASAPANGQVSVVCTCGWTATVSEARWRMDPVVSLRAVVEGAKREGREHEV